MGLQKSLSLAHLKTVQTLENTHASWNLAARKRERRKAWARKSEIVSLRDRVSGADEELRREHERVG